MSADVLSEPNLILTIRGLLPALNEQEQKVGQYVIDHPYEVIHLSMVDLAERCGVGDTTIFRFCRRIRTEGYQDFKIRLAEELTPRSPAIYAAVAAGDALAEAVRGAIARDTRSLEDTLRILDLEALRRAAEALLTARRVDIYGSGGSAVAAFDLQYKLMRVGVRSQPYADVQLQATSAALLTPADVAIGISHSGAAPDVLHALKLARRAGARTIAFTNHPASPLAGQADISLFTAAQEAAEGYPSGTRVAQVGLIDALCTCLLLKRQTEDRS